MCASLELGLLLPLPLLCPEMKRGSSGGLANLLLVADTADVSNVCFLATLAAASVYSLALLRGAVPLGTLYCNSCNAHSKLQLTLSSCIRREICKFADRRTALFVALTHSLHSFTPFFPPLLLKRPGGGGGGFEFSVCVHYVKLKLAIDFCCCCCMRRLYNRAEAHSL